MNHTRRRHVAALSSVVSIGLVVAVVAGTASAASDRVAARSNSQWLAKQLKPDGTLENPNGGTLPDHGLMIDTLFALHASGDGALAAPIAGFLDEGGHATDYFTWDGLVPGEGYEAIIVGGAAAKVLVAAEVSGHDPRSFDGYDMVAETKAAIMRSGPDKGRVSDYTKNPDFADFVSNNANMFGQALGVIGLAAAGENDQLAIDKLITQQCSEGYFRIFFGLIPTDETGDHVTPNGQKISTCDEGKPFGQSTPDGDATGLALSALVAARSAGAPGLDAPIARTVAWLKANQTASGGWGGGVGTEAANTNSTGLIAQALADAGGSGAEVDRGVGFLKSAQANAAADAGNALAGHIGAIAYNPDSYLAGRTSGITALDPWIRASAQASLGLSQVGFFALAKGEIPGDPSSTTGTTSTTTTTTTTTTIPPGPPTTTTPTTTTAPTTTTTTTTSPEVVPNAQGEAPGNATSPPRTVVRTVVLPPPTNKAQPATPTPASRLGAYLANQLLGGDHVEVTQDGKTFVDYDATAELVLALRALGEQPTAVERASKFLLTPESVKAYAHGAPYETGAASYAEPLAKLLIVARFAAADEAAKQLHDDLTALRGPDGKFTDKGSFGDADNTVRRHAWIAMATTDSTAIDLLTKHQCDDGTFPAELTTDKCASGDTAATAAAVLALNSGPRTDDPPATEWPDAWSEHRATALVAAAAALTARTDGKGLITGDVALSSAVAGARQFAGLDASATARSLGELVPATGGVPNADGRADLFTSLAVASGVAGRSWASATGSPVSPVVRLPLAAHKAEQAAQEPQPVQARALAVHWPALLIGLGGIVLVIALGLVAGRVVARNKGVAP
ncbi:hypothetical protein FKR81_19155 [Lentzea tibetensis]|uniref:Prenyltransferase and squalene oxidase repeat-containing protein n=1 Tax=Lentzea tibetensis TaxID=2591470 RepID=A0A563ESP5_9PSEU|nr:hypothetical protein [Lentzea tibetensis]TWP50727.1 hypothetical protein FKR81_19155 [Lentzea tibetensis]